MNADPPVQTAPNPGAGTGDTGTTSRVAPPGPARPSTLVLVALALALAALVTSGLLWQKLSVIREQLARQSADSGVQAVEARTLARQAQELARDTAARLALSEVKLSEVALQRTQLEDLIQSLSRSRDENLVVDIDSALRLAQQQASLTGSAEPLLAALRSADQRIARAAQPRLTPLQRAITKDIERIKVATLADTPGLLIKLDELARLVDELPIINAVAQPSSNAAVKAALAAKPSARAASAARSMASSAASDATSHAAAYATSNLSAWPAWLQKVAGAVRDEARGLVRVSKIDNPQGVLLSPEQSFFIRENLKLKILNARLGLLARQGEASHADLAQAATSLANYFDTSQRATQQAQALVAQLQSQMRAVDLPRVDDTLAALATAAAGR